MKYYNITNKEKKGEIIINGVIGDFWSDSNDSKRFLNDFRDLEEKYEDIDIRILNCPGGSVSEGKAIFSTIRNSPSNTTIYVDSMAASMGFYIMLAGKRRFMEKRSRAMSHKAKGGVIGNSDELRNIADELDKFEDEVVDLMHDITGKSKKWLRQAYFTNTDKYITAKEAMSIKLIDGIFDNGEVIQENFEDMKQQGLFNYYDNKLKLTDMENTKMFIDLLNLEKGSTEADIFSKVSQLVKDNDTLTQEKTNLEVEKETMEDELKTLRESNKDVTKERAEILIDNAIETGKISVKNEQERQDWVNKAIENYDAYKDILSGMQEKKNDIQAKKQSLHDKLTQPQPTGSGGAESVTALAKEWDDLRKSGKLINLKETDNERYLRLYEAKHGCKPTIVANKPSE